MERIPSTASEVGARRLAAGLLLLGFLLLIPAVLINAPGFGATSPWGSAFPFLFERVAQLYWSSIFVVITLYGLVILEGILRRAGEEIFSRLGLVSFTLAAVLWLLGIVLDTNGVPGLPCDHRRWHRSAQGKHRRALGGYRSSPVGKCGVPARAAAESRPALL